MVRHSSSIVASLRQYAVLAHYSLQELLDGACGECDQCASIVDGIGWHQRRRAALGVSEEPQAISESLGRVWASVGR